jgi:tetratricopeptide (TPR) repeat protein
MSNDLAVCYYRLALYHAKMNDLSGAVRHARRSLRLDAKNASARKLLGICLCELGELDSALCILEGCGELSDEVRIENERTRETIRQARELAARKKWRKADAVLRSNMRQSVRILNIRGCMKAVSGSRRSAAQLFALALKKDTGNRDTRAYLIQASGV